MAHKDNLILLTSGSVAGLSDMRMHLFNFKIKNIWKRLQLIR